MRLFIFTACLALVFVFTPAQAKEGVLDIQEVESTKNIKAWLVEDHSVPVIALKFSFKGRGAALDPADKQGLSRLASNTMDEGAGDLDSQSFQKELADLAISLHFSSDRDNFGGNLKTLTKNKDRAFELLKLALTQPRFDEEPVQRMRQANQSRIRSSLSDPEWMAARILNDVAFAGHPYAHNSGGTLTTLDNITIEDLRKFAKALSREELVVAAAGDITAQELSTILDQIFGSLPEKNPVPEVEALDIQNKGKTYLHKKDIPQTVIQITQPGITRKDPDYHTAQVMNFILGSSGFGSRLTREIRENRGLTYGIYSYFYNLDKLAALSVSTSTENKNVSEMMSLIKAEWAKMTVEPITEKELKNAKSYLIGSLPLSLTSTNSIAGLLLSLQLDDLPINYLDEREKAIEAATAEDVLGIAQKTLNTGAFVTVLVGQPEGENEFELVETIPNVE